MPYDQRIMRCDGLDHVSLTTLEGRVLVSFLIGPYHRQRFDAHEPRQCHLVVREDGTWFLLVVVQVPDGAPMPPTDFLGVDLGVATLAMTSDGLAYHGTSVEACRARYLKYRRRLQRAATLAQMEGKRPKNIRRALKRTAKREARFRKDTNHCISNPSCHLLKSMGFCLTVTVKSPISPQEEPARGRQNYRDVLSV